MGMVEHIAQPLDDYQKRERTMNAVKQTLRNSLENSLATLQMRYEAMFRAQSVPGSDAAVIGEQMEVISERVRDIEKQLDTLYSQLYS